MWFQWFSVKELKDSMHSELHGIQDYVGAGVVLPNYDYEDISKLSALVVLTSIMLQKLLIIYDGNYKTHNYSIQIIFKQLL